MPALEDDGKEGSKGSDEDGEGINPPREADAVTELREPVVTNVVDDWDGDDGSDAYVEHEQAHQANEHLSAFRTKHLAHRYLAPTLLNVVGAHGNESEQGNQQCHSREDEDETHELSFLHVLVLE